MKKNKTENGITLVALIVTIIVLLILAIVAIGIVRGDGILFHAKDASTKYAEKAAEENNALEGYGEIIKEQITGVKKVAVGTIAQKNSTINGEAPSTKNPIIPAGFMAKNTETSKWDAAEGPEIDKGLVITDAEDPTDMTGNEFVWVPVTNKIEAYGLGTEGYREPDVVTGEGSTAEDSASGSEYDAVEDNLKLAGLTEDLNGDGKVNAYDFKIQLTNDFNHMVTSANQYGGFYVGRYETSMDSNGIAQSVYGETSATANFKSANQWYGLYRIQRQYSTSSVQGSMIWGSQWDIMMEWMGDKVDSHIVSHLNQNRETGTYEQDFINNIYDLYGNSNEGTLEANGNQYRNRRGSRHDGGDGPKQKTDEKPYYAEAWAGGNTGSRLSLYIK